MLWFLPFLLVWFLGVSDLCAQKAEPEQENEVAALPREPTSAEMMQREIDRRREETFRLNEILTWRTGFIGRASGSMRKPNTNWC